MIQLSLSTAILESVKYADRYKYPLTAAEIHAWILTPTSPDYRNFNLALKKLVSQGLLKIHADYYFLPDRSHLVNLRHNRTFLSRAKWIRAQRIGVSLSHIPTIQAIFVTGSLAVDNSDSHDDIDFMIITSANTLWVTRLLVVILLKFKNIRRDRGLPEHSSQKVEDKICDNLYLDTEHLYIPHSPATSVYLSHEILQAKCLFSRSDCEFQFLDTNRWVSQYFPRAYSSQIKNYKPKPTKPKPVLHRVLSLLNLLLYISQYIYMRSKMTSERVGPGFAFFHPH